ncbi:PREDICTED: protein ABHD11-like isoform X1 [Prunus mume]|uniref:Protein ABHD11-like isoform X1 n=1 Tax=Prunus mume TaxID=102107 RepID=A0ABM0PRU3_PRUMU|nr:PREDICTED: protein ABHD11-like isoform X1 [Prunus mume]
MIPLPKRSAKSPMARTIGNKSGLHDLLTRFVISRRPLQTVAYEELRPSTDTKPYHSTAFVLHGLLGSARTWRSFSRTLLSNLSSPSGWRMVLVDLRNHGRSAEIEGLNPPHDLVNAAHDLAHLIQTRGWAWPDVVLGHSFGGKVALQFAQSCVLGHYGDSAKVPKQLWVLDSLPGEVNPENRNKEVERVLHTLQSLPSSVPSRKWLMNHLTELGFSKSLSHWIGSNLKKHGDHETWAFDLDVAVQMFNSYQEKSYWPLLEHPPKDMEIAVVRGENSDRWDVEDIEQLESLANREGDGSEGKVSVHVLPESGHWVHVDNPKGLLEIVAPKISSLRP